MFLYANGLQLLMYFSVDLVFSRRPLGNPSLGSTVCPALEQKSEREKRIMKTGRGKNGPKDWSKCGRRMNKSSWICWE